MIKIILFIVSFTNTFCFASDDPSLENAKVVKLNAGEMVTIKANEQQTSNPKSEECQGSDSVGTKVVCNCVPTEKIVEKPVIKYKTQTRWKTKLQVVEKPVEKIVTKEIVKEQNKNNLSLFVGQGPSAIEFYKYDEEYRARDGFGVVTGLIYQRSLTPSFNVGVGGATNDTLFGTIGVSW